MNEQIINAMKWRYATKKYDTAKKVNDADYSTIKEAMRLAPSAYGIQPWVFIEVTDPAVREKLRAAAYGQAQVTEADKFIVIASKTDAVKAVDEYIADMAKKSGKTAADFADFAGMMKGDYNINGAERLQRHAYIPLGIATETAALLGIDGGAMEGFSVEQFDEILGLTAKGLTASVLLGLGYRSEEDENSKNPKIRFDNPFITI